MKSAVLNLEHLLTREYGANQDPSGAESRVALNQEDGTGMNQEYGAESRVRS